MGVFIARRFPKHARWNDDDTALLKPDGGSINMQALEAALRNGSIADLYRPLIKVVRWVGDGETTQSISGVGFRPDGCVFKAETAESASFYHRMTWRGNRPRMGEAMAHVSGGVVSLDSDGITVDGVLNSSGVIYHAVLLADNGSGKIAFGSYAGNGVDNREIDIGLAPVWVMVKRDNTFPCWVRAVGMSTSYPLSAAASADNIKSLTASGFTVGTADDVNAVSASAGSGGEAYDYIAFADCELWRVMQYVGNNTARTLAVIDDVAFALIKSHDSGTPRDAQICITTMPTGQSANINGAVESGHMSLAAGVVTLGASAVTNGSGVTNTVLAIQEASGVQFVETRPSLPAVRIGVDGGLIAPTRNTDFALNGVPFSFEIAFVYRATAPATVITLISVNENNLNSGHHFGLQLSTAYRSLQFQCTETGPATQTYEYGFQPKDGELIHLGFSFDGVSEVLIVVDGKFIKRASDPLTIAATGTPANAKVTVGNRRSGSDSVSPSFDATDCSFVLWRIYDVTLTAAQWERRYKRAILRDFSVPDVTPLDEWDAANVAGTTLYATLKAANNMTLISCTTELV